LRVVIAEDLALLREGLVALLRESQIDVVAQVQDAPALLRAIDGHKPDLAIVDVRLPPSFSDEGLLAAIEARRRHPQLGVLVLSQYVETAYASELIGGDGAGIGYLLKERVGDVRAFLDALHTVAEGGTVLDRQVVAELLACAPEGGAPRDGATGALSALTAREREVLALMAEGRSNTAIADSLVVTPGAVEKHITGIFAKLDLSACEHDHRRVLAVLAYLRVARQADPTDAAAAGNHGLTGVRPARNP
jgi:DNA-binding NarL/FixJ family response regulator